MSTEMQPNHGSKRLAALLLVLTAIVYSPFWANRAVIDYDEDYYSQAALHMARSGDWVTPYVNGVRFLEKPPLMFWLTAASFRIFAIASQAQARELKLGGAELMQVLDRVLIRNR